MSKKILAVSMMVASLWTVQTYAAINLSTPTQKLSYTIGYEMGQNFKKQNVNIDNSALMQGLQDGITGQTAEIATPQRQQAIADFQKQMIVNQENQLKAVAEQNLKNGKVFLLSNGKQPGVITLRNGLQYKIITAGKGPKPTLTDTVTVNYSGHFINGKIFDSSYKRGKPTTFELNQVIKGWQQALTMMPTGSTWEVYVPSSLAYGDRGMVPVIGPNETLVFKINLISIKKNA